jgi:N,N'-diacetyllegionaminate synthase
MKTHIIAELGINHNGDINLCKKMITEAKKCGANSVKLQILKPRNISSDPNLIKAQESASFKEGEIFELNQFCKKNNIEIFSSVGDIESLKLFKKFNYSKIKLSSSNLNNWQLHEEVVKLKIPVIASVGDASFDEIETVVNFYTGKKINISIMHCIPDYPTKIEDTHLNMIPFLKDSFQIPVGFSDHSTIPEISILSIAYGATIIEKHFTLDKSMSGPDHHFSLNPEEFKLLVSGIKVAEKAGGNIFEYFKKVKEKKSLVRRSIVFNKSRKKGHIIKQKDIIIARPKYYSRLAIDPLFYKKIIGLSLNKNLKSFEPIKYEDVKNLKL